MTAIKFILYIGDTEIITSDAGKKIMTTYKRRKHKQAIRRLSSIKPIIGHLKQEQLEEPFLKE